MNDDWQHAFVCSLPDSKIDETGYAKIAADYVGVKCNNIEIESKVDISGLLDYLYICEIPYIATPTSFIQTYKGIKDYGIKVTLDGHGADEIFGGYNTALLAYCYDIDFESSKLDELLKQYNEMMKIESQMSISRDDLIRDAIAYNQKIRLINMDNKLDYVNRSLYYETNISTLPTLLRCYDRIQYGKWSRN